MSSSYWKIVPVECVHCGGEVETSFNKIRSLERLTCPHCKKTFHIFDVYDLYYDEEPIVKESVDFILKYASQPYMVEAKDKKSKKAIKDFLQKIKFEKIAERIFNDLVKYGNCYLEIMRNGKEILDLKPLDAKTVAIELGPLVQRGRAYTGERQVKGFIVKTSQGEKRLQPNDIVHFKQRDIALYEPYGESAIRIALRYIHYLRTTRISALAINAEWWINHLRNYIALGIGVPPILLEKDYSKISKTILEMASTYVSYRVQSLHWTLRGPMQHGVFAEIIRSKGLSETPRLEWKRLDPKRIMVDGGVIFTEEMRMLKRLLDSGVITKQQYDEKISEYLPPQLRSFKKR